jgi:hypothetical protein
LGYHVTAFFSHENKDACLLFSWVLKPLMPADTNNEPRKNQRQTKTSFEQHVNLPEDEAEIEDSEE